MKEDSRGKRTIVGSAREQGSLPAPEPEQPEHRPTRPRTPSSGATRPIYTSPCPNAVAEQRQGGAVVMRRRTADRLARRRSAHDHAQVGTWLAHLRHQPRGVIASLPVVWSATRSCAATRRTARATSSCGTSSTSRRVIAALEPGTEQRGVASRQMHTSITPPNPVGPQARRGGHGWEVTWPAGPAWANRPGPK